MTVHVGVVGLGYWRFGWNSILSFWLAYVATRPLGASFADWMGKPHSVGGLGWGDGTVAVALAIAIFGLVAYLGLTARDVQGVRRGQHVGDGIRLRAMEPSPERAD